MSLVSSFIYCKDGKFYRNLVYRGENWDWFICFDDQDPVELVVRRDYPPAKPPMKILGELGIPYYAVEKRHSVGERLFEFENLKKAKLHPATSYFLKVHNKPFPTPREYDLWDGDPFEDGNDIVQGVIYGLEYRKKCSNRRCSNLVQYEDDDFCPWCKEEAESL